MMAEIRIPHIATEQKATQAGNGKLSLWNREIRLGKTFPENEKKEFFRNLSVLLGSGLTLDECLEILPSENLKGTTFNIIERLRKSLHEGNSFSLAMKHEGDVFTPFEIASVMMGESTGRMAEVMMGISSYHDKRQRLRRKLVQAFSYPIVVTGIAIAVLSFMITWVVPMFEGIFQRFDAELPAITRFVLDLSAMTRQQGPWMMVVVLITATILWRLRNRPGIRRGTANLLLKIPVAGNLIHKIQLSRFCYSLSMMLKSRVTLDQALRHMPGIIAFEPLRSTFGMIQNDVMEGKTFHEAIGRHSIYPSSLQQMIRVGEKTARLDIMLENAGQKMEEESEAGIQTLTGLLEPALIVILGVIVGVILISMYLPMFELSNAIGNT